MAKQQDGRVPTIQYEYPMFEDLLEPLGALAINKESHACFYYTMLATKARAIAGKGPEDQMIQYKVGEEIPLWREPRDAEIAISVALIYGLDSPSDFLKPTWIKRAWHQARLLGIKVPEEIYEVQPKRIH